MLLCLYETIILCCGAFYYELHSCYYRLVYHDILYAYTTNGHDKNTSISHDIDTGHNSNNNTNNNHRFLILVLVSINNLNDHNNALYHRSHNTTLRVKRILITPAANNE